MFEVFPNLEVVNRIKEKKQKEEEERQVKEYLPKVSKLMERMWGRGVRMTMISLIESWRYGITGELLLPGERVIQYHTPKELYEKLIEAGKMMSRLKKEKEI